MYARKYYQVLPPTHAGNTFYVLHRHRQLTVLPRACGEHDILQFFHAAIFCPSPRMRETRHPALNLVIACSFPRMQGTPRHCRIRRRFRLFFPAYAGNTLRRPDITTGWLVIPHACREHSLQEDDEVDVTWACSSERRNFALVIICSLEPGSAPRRKARSRTTVVIS